MLFVMRAVRKCETEPKEKMFVPAMLNRGRCEEMLDLCLPIAFVVYATRPYVVRLLRVQFLIIIILLMLPGAAGSSKRKLRLSQATGVEVKWIVKIIRQSLATLLALVMRVMTMVSNRGY